MPILTRDAAEALADAAGLKHLRRRVWLYREAR